MSRIASVSAKNFRCFKNTGEIVLSRVNLLVGENSSGKTTMLALIRSLADVMANKPVQFNKPPFMLGSFDEIAFNIGGKYGRVTNFTIACEYQMPSERNRKEATERESKNTSVEVSFIFSNRSSQLSFSNVIFRFSDGDEIDVDFEPRRVTFKVKPNGLSAQSFAVENRSKDEPKSSTSLFDVFLFSRLATDPQLETVKDKTYISVINRIQTFVFSPHATEVYASTPIRNQPRRTYDPVSGDVSEESNYALQNLASLKRIRQEEWKVLKKTIEEAGSSSGLFSGFDIRLLGKNESDPFQARVKIGGKTVNIVDVGFGVSQMIPVIYDLLVVKAPLVLVQQPETHLHPRAQVGLGEIIASLPSRKPDQTYVIETHSDHLIDSICMAVREGRARMSDFNIVFFEKVKGASESYQMRIGQDGVIQNQPKSYREFFLRHQGRLFGLD